MRGRAPGDLLLDTAWWARTGLRWLGGMSIAMWRYAFRSVPLARTQRRLPGEDPGPTDRAAPGDQAALQPRVEGAGPAFRRRYRVRVRGPRLDARALMDRITRDPNLASPVEVARFVKTRGRLGEMREGDEYLVWMPGPWNGPVRVAHRTPTSFRLATLQGHMEAGEIVFSARDDDGDLVFQIESAARSGTRPFWFAYGPLRFAREMQMHVWAHFCEQAAEISGGVPEGAIEILSLEFPDDRGQPSRAASRRARRHLDRLHLRPVNYDDADPAQLTPERGWTVDDHRIPLPPEAPGDPEAGGAWEVASDLVRHYQFADPRLIQAVYYPDVPLERRDMLLEGRFLGLTFMLGVRVARVIDEDGERDGRPVRVAGWSYRTLQGHLEAGQMDFEVIKWRDTGEVEFHIHAVSRRYPVRNPVVRVGFRLFGRGLQLRFARLAAQRMRRLVDERLAGRGGAPAGAESVPVRPAHADPRAEQRLDA